MQIEMIFETDELSASSQSQNVEFMRRKKRAGIRAAALLGGD